jgi:predicted nuclease of predicted toxin-antitoxin system
VRFKLYLDEDVMSGGLVQALRLRGIDVISVRDTQLQGRTDEYQLEYATSVGRVLYSFNVRDFMALHTRFLQEGRSHSGIILAKQEHRFSVGEQMRLILRIMTDLSAEQMQNQVVFLSTWLNEL